MRLRKADLRRMAHTLARVGPGGEIQTWCSKFHRFGGIEHCDEPDEWRQALAFAHVTATIRHGENGTMILIAEATQ